MDKLPDALVAEILSRLDSADVARCRVAWKTFDNVYPNLRSINLQWPLQRYIELRARVLNSLSSSSRLTYPFKTIFLNLVSKLRAPESVHIGVENLTPYALNVNLQDYGRDMYLTDGAFVKEWLPRVSGALKSLSISDFSYHSFKPRQSEVLWLVSSYCHNLLELKVKHARLSVDNSHPMPMLTSLTLECIQLDDKDLSQVTKCFPNLQFLNLKCVNSLKLPGIDLLYLKTCAWLSVNNLHPMPMLTSLTLERIQLDDKDLSQVNKCFPNLQVLNLKCVRGFELPRIHLLHLKTCHWTITNSPPSLTLITPNLITLRLEGIHLPALYIEAPLLSHFDLRIACVGDFSLKTFANLKTLSLASPYISSLIVKFPHIETIENLTLYSLDLASAELAFNRVAWDGRKALKTFRGYLKTVDSSLTFSLVGCMIDRCFNLVDVSLLFHRDIVATDHVSRYFMGRCMTQWPNVKWRWGMWKEGMEDSWIIDGIPNAQIM